MFLPKLMLYIYPVQMLEDIKGVLDASKEMPNNLKRESAKIIKFSKIGVLRYYCQGCFTEHSCQDQHISHGGVLNRSHGLNKLLSTSSGVSWSLREQEDVDCKHHREENGSAGAVY